MLTVAFWDAAVTQVKTFDLSMKFRCKTNHWFCWRTWEPVMWFKSSDCQQKAFTLVKQLAKRAFSQLNILKNELIGWTSKNKLFLLESIIQYGLIIITGHYYLDILICVASYLQIPSSLPKMFWYIYLYKLQVFRYACSNVNRDSGGQWTTWTLVLGNKLAKTAEKKKERKKGEMQKEKNKTKNKAVSKHFIQLPPASLTISDTDISISGPLLRTFFLSA